MDEKWDGAGSVWSGHLSDIVISSCRQCSGRLEMVGGACLSALGKCTALSVRE